MNVLSSDLPDKITQPINQFIFLTSTKDFTARKTTATEIARAHGQHFFAHVCKRYDASEYYSSCMACVECQEQWYRGSGKHKPDPDIKPFSSAYIIAVVFFKDIRL